MQRLFEIHDELLLSVATGSKRLRDMRLATFFPLKGAAATDELMVVGRAVNGWLGRGWTAAEALDSRYREQLLKEVVPADEAGLCPMHWLTDRWSGKQSDEWNPRRSSYCRLIHAVVRDLGISTDDSWPSKLIWSNLYKIAPYEGGTPGNRLCNIQQASCEEHLVEEVRYWKPRRLLFITGFNWVKPFIKRFHCQLGGERDGQVCWSGLLQVPGNGQSIETVVSVRPERQPKSLLVDEIVQAFQSMQE